MANKRYVVCLLGLLLAAGVTRGRPAFGQQEQTANDDRPPNIVFIMADDLGYGHLGAYGQEKINTPNIDRLAEQGMTFTQAYSEHICAPTRSVLMTGMHNGHARIRSNGPGMFLFPVPFIARWPGRVEAGSVSDLPIYFPDVMPTLAEVAGTSTPEIVEQMTGYMERALEERHPFEGVP